MAAKKGFALSLILTFYAAHVAAKDNCFRASDGEYELMSPLPTGKICSSTSSACAKTPPNAKESGCPCGAACCQKVAGTCSKVRDGGASCGIDRTYDKTKKAVAATTANYDTTCCMPKTCKDLSGNACGANRKADSSKAAVQATMATYDATCCKAKTKCDTHTCGTGYKDSAAKATTFCHMDTCLDSTCCEVDCTDCCYSQMMTGKSCPATHYTNSKAMTASATAANFEANCCVAKKNCDVTCPVGKKSKAAGTKCSGATCSEFECCDADDSVCKGVSGQTCAANFFRDDKKEANTVDKANLATSFKAQCCTEKTTCAAFSAWVAPVSIATLPQVTSGALLFVLGGVLISS